MPEIETLTEEERAELERLAPLDPSMLSRAEEAGVKLLRLHDALQARVKELEGQLADKELVLEKYAQLRAALETRGGSA